MDAHSYVLKSLEASTFLRDILRAGAGAVVVVVADTFRMGGITKAIRPYKGL